MLIHEKDYLRDDVDVPHVWGFTDAKRACVHFVAALLQQKRSFFQRYSLDDLLSEIKLSDVTKKVITAHLAGEWDSALDAAYAISPKAVYDFFKVEGETVSRGGTSPDMMSILNTLFGFGDADIFAFLAWEDGSFLLNFFDSLPKELKVIVPVLNKDFFAFLEMRLYILKPERKIEAWDRFLIEAKSQKCRFAKLFFADVPVALPEANLTHPRYFGAIRQSEESTWAQLERAMALVRKNGLCVALVPDSTLTSSENNVCRKRILIDYSLELVLHLPPLMGDGMRQPRRSLVILRATEHHYVHYSFTIVNARDMPLSAIVEALHAWKESQTLKGLESKSITVSMQNVFHNRRGNTFLFDHYKEIPEEVVEKRNVRKLSEVADILRGSVNSSLTKEKILETPPENEKWVRYATQADISADGVVTPSKYVRVSDLSPRDKDSLISSETVVLITRMARPVKVAVLKLDEGDSLLLGPHLYAIRCHKNDLDPYYLKVYLESDFGKNVLDLLPTGNTVPTISIRQLETMQVACPKFSDQEEIGKKYVKILGEINNAYRKIAIKRQAIKKIANGIWN